MERECAWRCDAEQQAASHRLRQAQEEARASEQRLKAQLEGTQAEARGLADANAAIQARLKHVNGELVDLQARLVDVVGVSETWCAMKSVCWLSLLPSTLVLITKDAAQEHARELQAFKDAHGESYMELRRTAKALKSELEREQQRRAELVEDVGGVRDLRKSIISAYQCPPRPCLQCEKVFVYKSMRPGQGAGLGAHAAPGSGDVRPRQGNQASCVPGGLQGRAAGGAGRCQGTVGGCHGRGRPLGSRGPGAAERGGRGTGGCTQGGTGRCRPPRS